MICDICAKEGAVIRRITRAYGEGPDLVVVEHVPAVFCPNCGESYITAGTLFEIDKALETGAKAAKTRPVGVLTLEDA